MDGDLVQCRPVDWFYRKVDVTKVLRDHKTNAKGLQPVHRPYRDRQEAERER